MQRKWIGHRLLKSREILEDEDLVVRRVQLSREREYWICLGSMWKRIRIDRDGYAIVDPED